MNDLYFRPDMDDPFFVNLAFMTREASLVKLSIFRCTPTGERVDYKPVISLRVGKEAMQRHSRRWEATFNQENPLPETKPMDNGEGFEIQVQNPNVFFYMLCAVHDFLSPINWSFALQDLFDMTIMAEKQGLWGSITHIADMWLKGQAFGTNFENESKSVFLENPLQWLVISWLWGIQDIFDIVFPSAIAETDADTFKWTPKADPMDTSTGNSVFVAGDQIDKLKVLSNYVEVCRRQKLERCFALAQDFEKSLLNTTEPCDGRAWTDHHDHEECKKTHLRSLQRTCTALDYNSRQAADKYEQSPMALLDELEVVAAGLEHHDGLSRTVCNRLKADVKRDKQSRWKPELERRMRVMLAVTPVMIGLEIFKLVRLQKRLRQMTDA